MDIARGRYWVIYPEYGWKTSEQLISEAKDLLANDGVPREDTYVEDADHAKEILDDAGRYTFGHPPLTEALVREYIDRDYYDMD